MKGRKTSGVAEEESDNENEQESRKG